MKAHANSVRPMGTASLRWPMRRPARRSGHGQANPSLLRVAYTQNAAVTATEAHSTRPTFINRSEEHTSELQSPCNLVCRLLLEKKKQNHDNICYARHALPPKHGEHGRSAQ